MHPQPMQDELFSSWLVRLAFSNHFPLHSFYSGLLGFKGQIWNRDIDRSQPDQLLTLLSQATGQPLQVLQGMSLARYEGTFYQQLSSNGSIAWLLPLGIFHRTHKLAGLQYCPLCLNEDPLPYYRQPWRVALAVACKHHGCVMEDLCSRCKAPIIFHRHGVGRDKCPHVAQLRKCHACGADLGLSIPRYPSWPDERTLELSMALATDFEACPWRQIVQGVPCAMPFFVGLHKLLSLLNGRYGERLQRTFCPDLGVEVLLSSKLHFERQGIERRLQLVLRACWLLQEWPERFVRCCRTMGMSRSRTTELPGMLPYWLETVLSNHLDLRVYFVSEQEVSEAANYLAAHGQEVALDTLMPLLGQQRDATRRLFKQWCAGRDRKAALMRS
ncbi:TniQ family protein [Pseudomonas nitroreducens]|uniref:TniQ family protein n=1 Tax=Pseudomonas nitroreducens TaxID=46680 RepID=UPI001FB6382F|nr:TniQ family protein [Pseudomonas nitroreducens]MCJ1880675.1 TniQ family protein [Pseudomonas nitroreducens]MCJ1893991.1 TniQ family protein [Pseudomonas nitroreducens]MDP5414546.1 TniQ family protein [Pseudomonas aeruginosa]HBN8384874.1 TniQ family protein [Pseudomonas aeruginosa]